MSVFSLLLGCLLHNPIRTLEQPMHTPTLEWPL